MSMLNGAGWPPSQSFQRTAFGGPLNSNVGRPQSA
jgi:hypothetical protein